MTSNNNLNMTFNKDDVTKIIEMLRELNSLEEEILNIKGEKDNE